MGGSDGQAPAGGHALSVERAGCLPGCFWLLHIGGGYDRAHGGRAAYPPGTAGLPDRAPDMVMFDVPPPYEGLRGIDAYRDSWPGFFRWQASGASFELESLHVTAGTDVAFAYGLLCCGTPADFDRDPDQRLRLTIGLRKTDERWVVTHEHHSFTDTTG